MRVQALREVEDRFRWDAVAAQTEAVYRAVRAEYVRSPWFEGEPVETLVPVGAHNGYRRPSSRYRPTGPGWNSS